MITLALDEFGKFEVVKRMEVVAQEQTGCILIGGLIYNDLGDKEDLENEHNRIKAYYSKIVSSIPDAVYPRNLHVMKGEEGKEFTRDIKIEVSQSLAEFLQNGTYKEEELLSENSKRKGFYKVIVVLKSETGKTIRTDNEDLFINDSYGSNLYFHMVSEFLSHAVFDNFDNEAGTEYSLQIATRASINDKSSDNGLFEQYNEQGYKPVNKNPNNCYYILTNQDVYRTLIEQKLMEHENDVKISRISAESIDYLSEHSQEFLYLADSICSYLTYDSFKVSDGNYLKFIRKKLAKLIENDNSLLYSYDDVDTEFTKAIRAMSNRDIYVAMSYLYDIKTNYASYVAEYYENKWYPHLLNKINKEVNTDDWCMAVDKLTKSLLSNTYNQKKGQYLFEELERTLEVIKEEFKTSQMKYLYYFYNAGVSVYSHLGDSSRAKVYEELCIDYAQYVDLEKMLRLRNQQVVMLCDYFDYEHARVIAEENVKISKETYKIKALTVPKADIRNKFDVVKALSQLGQVYAFMQDSQAENCFLEALEDIEEGTPDYYITASYLLHHYIDSGNERKYRELAKKYFNGEDLLEAQTDMIIRELDDSHPQHSFFFALYVLVKATYVFYKQEVSDELWNKLTKVFTYKSQKTDRNSCSYGHPVELICHYLILLSYYRDDEDSCKLFKSHLRKCLKNSNALVNAIIQFGNIEIHNSLGYKDSSSQYLLNLRDFLAEGFYFLKDIKDITSEEDLYALYKKLFVYMYC
ncbi:MAG: hypothetical protein MJ172_07275 [Clostridia bacterium]|nr:hypothetical protein [Clostridia bacterium]